VLGFGNQITRLPALTYFLTYTLCFSLPTLATILYLKTNFNLLVSSYTISTATTFIFIISFSVKLPIFGLHQWLPKAHVESPTLGSCILASVLLKTGSYGIFIIIKWTQTIWSPIWRLMGSSFLTILARVQVDIKKLVAYRRICHLNLVLASLLSNSLFSNRAFILISLTHGFISSGMFYLAGSISYHRRLIYYLKSNLLINWLIILSLNFGFPTTHAFLSEILAFRALILTQPINTLLLIIYGGFILWFSIILWLQLKSKVAYHTNSASIILSWHYLPVLIIWINPSLFF